MKKYLLSLAAAVLAVSGAMADEAIFNFNTTLNVYGLTFQNAATLKPDIALPKTIEDGGGYLTMNVPESTTGGFAFGGRASSPGLYVCPGTDNPSITLSADASAITNVSITLANPYVPCYIDGKALDSDEENSNMRVWTGSKDSVTLSFESTGTPYDMVRIINVSFTFEEATAEKKEADLSFAETTATGKVGEDFTAPELVNPNNLPVTWTSSNTEVATVNESGEVTLVAAGTAVITASTEGNDEFKNGSASYELTVEAAAPVIYPLYPIGVTTDGDSVNVQSYFDDEVSQVVIFLTGSTTKDTLEVTITAPEGWDGIIGNVVDDGGVGYRKVRKEVEEEPIWESVATLEEEGLIKTNKFNFEIKTEQGVSTKVIAGFYVYENDMVYKGVSYVLIGEIKYDGTSGIETVDTVEENVKYYNLQGVEVKNPENGIFVKVAGDKVEKIVL